MMLDRLGETGYGGLSGDELMRLGVLYRRLTGDLATARARYTDPDLIDYLNRLARRGYNLVYRASNEQRRGSFFTRTFPGVLRRRMNLFGIGLALLYGPALVAYGLGIVNPTSLEYLFGLGGLQEFQHRIERGIVAPDLSETVFASATALMTNNIQVAFLAFAGGALAGTLTLYVMLVNGLMLGSVAALAAHAGFLGPLARDLGPHGVTELTAIGLACAAGLRLAGGIVMPGDLPRRKSIPLAAREAFTLMGGVVVLLVYSGIVEAAISFSPAIPATAKLAVTGVGTALCLLWLVWLPYRVGPIEFEPS